MSIEQQTQQLEEMSRAVEGVTAGIDAMHAENKRLRDALRRIAEVAASMVCHCNDDYNCDRCEISALAVVRQ